MVRGDAMTWEELLLGFYSGIFIGGCITVYRVHREI